jgi:hypothetical protein
LATCIGIGELGKEIDTGNTTTGEDRNTKDTTEWPPRLEKESAVNMVAPSTVDVCTRSMKDVRV